MTLLREYFICLTLSYILRLFGSYLYCVCKYVFASYVHICGGFILNFVMLSQHANNNNNNNNNNNTLKHTAPNTLLFVILKIHSLS
jgi:hypothetical protein